MSVDSEPAKLEAPQASPSDNTNSISTNAFLKPTGASVNGIITRLQPYAQSKFSSHFSMPWASGDSGNPLFASTAVIPPALFRRNANIPPFFHRAGFSVVFGGAAYVLSAGDIRNGSGIATAWSLTYLFLNLRRTLTSPRHPLGLAMTGGVSICAALYGTEYFWLQS